VCCTSCVGPTSHLTDQDGSAALVCGPCFHLLQKMKLPRPISVIISSSRPVLYHQRSASYAERVKVGEQGKSPQSHSINRATSPTFVPSNQYNPPKFEHTKSPTSNSFARGISPTNQISSDSSNLPPKDRTKVGDNNKFLPTILSRSMNQLNSTTTSNPNKGPSQPPRSSVTPDPLPFQPERKNEKDGNPTSEPMTRIRPMSVRYPHPGQFTEFFGTDKSLNRTPVQTEKKLSSSQSVMFDRMTVGEKLAKKDKKPPPRPRRRITTAEQVAQESEALRSPRDPDSNDIPVYRE
jgi:hypothetical protein